MKYNYSEPKMYTGGVDVSQWSKLTRGQQKNALQADWYIYYSFRDPLTGKLKRQPNIKAGVNRFKRKKERYDFIKMLRNNLILLLESGFSPYEYNEKLEQDFKDFNSSAKDGELVLQKNQVTQESVQVETTQLVEKITTLDEAFELALKTKESVLSESSFPKLKSRINQFRVWLKNNGILGTDDIAKIDKKVVIKYLNYVLQNTSARNRNNARTDISSFFQILEDNELIVVNFVKKINVLKSTPERNKTYTPSQITTIFEHLKTTDPILLLMIKFIYFGTLRPMEVCRLKIGDVDIEDRKLYVRAKNQPVKIKIIPEVLLNDIPNLEGISKEYFLFTPHRIGGQWDAGEVSKRTYFSKRFKVVKDCFKLGKDYGLYSFRHTFIARLYKEFAKEMTPFEVKSKLMLITGHSTMTALEFYLRNIDAELPEDFSSYLK